MGVLTRFSKAVPAAFVVLVSVQDTAQAATSRDLEHASSHGLPMESILQVDTLGFSCIPEADIDRAFHLTGKGLRMPRTCLPTPCDGAISRDTLGTLIGRPPTDAEWDDYYSRYADTCRAEITPFEPEEDLTPVFTAGDMAPFDVLSSDIGESLGPLATPIPAAPTLLLSTVLSSRSTGSSGGSTGSTFGGPSFLSGGGTGETLTILASDTTSTDSGGGKSSTSEETVTSIQSNTPAAIPAPAAVLLFASALLGLFGLRKRASNA